MQPRDLSDHIAYEAGRGHEEVARERGLDPTELVTLSSNENPLGPSPDAVAAIREHADAIHRYPKAAHVDLVEAIADRHDVAPTQVWLANGGDGALDYLARAMLAPGEAVLVPDPGFAYYGMSARYHHGAVTSYPVRREHDFAMDPATILEAYAGERIVYLTSPHNPTGAVADRAAIVELADGTAEDTLLVVDEAYAAFATVESACGLLDERDDVAVLRSFSKSHGLAGLRLGYALVPPAWADAYAKVSTPFAASELACRAGLAAVADDDHLEASVELARWGREYIAAELAANTWPSEGNFVLAAVGDAAEVTDVLFDRGVIVRDCTSFGLPDCIRISVGRREELRRAVATINDLLATNEVAGG